VVVVRHGGLVQTTIVPGAPFVATLEPGVRGTPEVAGAAPPLVEELVLELDPAARDAEVIEELPPDVATMDLAEAQRIVGGGAGLMTGADDVVADRFARLVAVGEAIGASMGATRVVTDAGWVPHQRQIGTTGVVVDPRLYLAFAISGAVQHTAGLGHPDHVIAVNVDQHCPMMAMADLAVVADANATLDALADRLGVVSPAGRGLR
jgi:electron transfer flavoprotein alpha subunit